MSTTITTVTTKGQVTIPKNVREALELKPHDQVRFILEEGRAFLIPVQRRSLSSLRGALPATRPYPGTAEIRKQVAIERGIALLNEEQSSC